MARAAEVATAEGLLEPILALHDSIRDTVVDACTRQTPEQLAINATGSSDAGDTIYAIDRVGEEALVRGLSELARNEPVCVVAEGIPDPLILPRGARESDCRWRLLVDPLDGTRGLMYQKRSAWILTGVAPNRGAATRLSDIVLTVQTEIPLLKQHLSDQLWASRGAGVEARRWNRVSAKAEPLTLRRSGAVTIAHGFATVVRFFPGAREILGAIDDEVVQALVKPEPRRASCFEDQYASTGGELYELIAGHDRFVADLRPLVKSASPPLCCHPYDLCTALIAREAGVIITDPSGAAVDAPLDLTTDVAWVGYANEALRHAIEPVLQGALRRRGLLR
ncbi:MAG: inositol monophosphatase [Gemmatimonadetes bacterium]|nr:MAG: inositol monophosphatase [Gemmatimonadetes bacterium 13_2_20CM_2_66_5]OLC85423.1 MAG: inositol monophosphatase [Gemmatimonadetes bacterium 13_1_40CM_3_66_12]OLD88571.1 MAG: inositol monophosphatase [Gemmatimonadetes bacterium 13_1_20CM_4_66_11]PYP98106.1 MAG: inositol monophosphatase [Gemmatimonadota bacterium]